VRVCTVARRVHNSKIKQQELPFLNNRYKRDNYFTAQEHNWCDEDLFVEWVKEVWKPITIVKGLKYTLLILDQYHVHKTARVLDALASDGTQVVHLPPAETGTLQVLDVGINKPFKENFIRKIQELDEPIGRSKVAEAEAVCHA
jgi:hypothetical protein